MYDFTFYNPTKVVFGRDAFAKLAPELAAREVSRVLLLYGGASAHASGAYEQITKSLDLHGIVYLECANVKPNPVISKVREAVEIIKLNKLQAIVAIGGGSVIDSAKGIAAGALYDGDVWDFYAKKAVPASSLPIYAAVTVSATASEMNHTSVLTNEELGFKVGLISETFFPKCTFIDPSAQFTVPERQTTAGGIDAICHVLETYFDGTKGLEVQKEYAEGLIRSFIRLIPILRRIPSDYDSRAQFAWASACALNGTTWAGHPGRGDFSSHAIGHSLSARYDSIHGETLSVIMPAWMAYVSGEDIPAFARFANRVFGIGGNEQNAAAEGIRQTKEFFASLGAAVSLRELGVPRADLGELAAHATRNGPLGTLKPLAAPDVMAILESAY